MRRNQVLLALFFTVFLFLALFQQFFSISATFYDSQRIAQASMLIAVGVLFFLSKECYAAVNISGKHYLKKFYLWSAMLLGLGLLSAITSNDALNSLMYVLMFALLFVMSSNIATLYDDKLIKVILSLVVVFHSSVVLYSLLFLSFALFEGDVIRPSVVYFGFDNIRFFNQVQILVLPLLAYLLMINYLSVLSYFLLSANLILMFVGGGLGVSLSWFCILVMLAFYNRRVFRILLLLTCIAFLCAFVSLNQWQLVEDSDKAIVVLSDGGRLPIWNALLNELSVRHFFLGIGPGLFVDLSGFSTVSHPHNFLLELLFEWGLPSLICGCVLVWLTVTKYFSSAFSPGVFSIRDAVFLSWLGGLIYSLVSGVLVMPVPQTLLFAYWGLLLGFLSGSQHSSSDGSTLDRSVRPAFVRWAVLALALVYTVMVLSSMLAMNDTDRSVQGPRYWLNGVRYL